MLLLVWAVKIQKPSLEQTLLPLALAINIIVFLAVWQFIAQTSIEGWWYWLGERQLDLSGLGIAKVTHQGRLLLRPYATFSHPNVLAGFLIGCLPLYLWLKDKLVLKLSTINRTRFKLKYL